MQFNILNMCYLDIVVPFAIINQDMNIAIQNPPKSIQPPPKSRLKRSPHPIPTLRTTSPTTSLTIRIEIPRTKVNRTIITLPLISKIERAPALILVDSRVDRKRPVVQHVAFEIARLRSRAVAAVGVNSGFFVAVGVEVHVEVVADVWICEGWVVSVGSET